MQDAASRLAPMPVGRGERRVPRWNARGTWTLASRECQRFLNVWTQTVLAPLVTAALFLLIFNLAIGPARGEVMGVPFLHFLAPGILTMTVIQNAFANTSSSIIVSKVQGNIVDTLMPPLSPSELTAGFLAGGVVRGLVVAVLMGALMVLALGQSIAHPLAALLFVALGSALLGALGVLAAIWAGKFDQMAAVTNFVVTPLAFLSGTFYSVETLPPAMAAITRANPVFYLIDGVRWSVLGRSDGSPALGLAILCLCTAVAAWLCWRAFRSGWRLKP